MITPVKRTTVLLVLGGGGHTTEMLRLREQMGEGYDYSFLLPRSVHERQRELPPGRRFFIVNPRLKNSHVLSVACRTFVATLQSFVILLRVRPKALIAAGPAVAVPAALLCRLFGARLIFIETGSRVTALSLTGKILRPFSNLFFVQWPELVDEPEIDRYEGRLL